MNKLLKVSFYRLFRSKMFYLCVAIVLILSLCIVLSNAPAMAEWVKAGEDCVLEDCYYNIAPMLGFVFAAFTSLFLGSEYTDGTIRNKLIAGHSRTRVFLSFFLVTAFACVVLTAVSLAGGLPGLYYFDGFGFGWNTYALCAGALFCSAILFSAIFTTISMLIPNRAVSAVVSLALWFALLFIGSAIVNMLAVPEMTCDYAWINGEYLAGEPYRNPEYVSGAARTVILAASHILPVCPAINIASGSLNQPFADIVYSLGATVVMLFSGCAVFRRKDLK